MANCKTDPRLPAEWEPQKAVIMAWPYAGTKWAPYLAEARKCISEIVRTILRFEDVILLAPDASQAKDLRGRFRSRRLHTYALPYDDIWARDFGPITVSRAGKMEILDFKFNGWGGKHPCAKDDRINSRLQKLGAFGRARMTRHNFVLEGGSIDSDGEGTILTTRKCLLNPNRNPGLDRKRIEKKLREKLGAERILWLANGEMEGDDTDSHIDTLARFADPATIVHMACDDRKDPHYDILAKMRRELESFRTASGGKYTLAPLPWPKPKFDAVGSRMPATYANFLIINGAVLVPTYRDKKDQEALRTVGSLFPSREVIGIDCLQLIHQHGSLHCATMQIPAAIRQRNSRELRG